MNDKQMTQAKNPFMRFDENLYAACDDNVERQLK